MAQPNHGRFNALNPSLESQVGVERRFSTTLSKANQPPPPRIHQHRYFGVLAPNSPLRSAVTAPVPAQATAQTGQTGTFEGASGVAAQGNAVQSQPEPVLPKRSPAHYLWAALIASFLRLCGTDRSYA